MDEIVQKKIVHDCFNENVERDCPNCPAHHTSDGICCFGDPEEHDQDDDDCLSCTFLDECAEACVEFEAEEEERRIEREAIRQSYTPSSRYRTTARIPKKKPGLVQIGGLKTKREVPTINKASRFVEREPVAVAEVMEGEPLFQRFLKESARGGLIGAFEMAANFLRTYKIP